MEDRSELKVVGDSAVEGSERVGGTVAKLSDSDGETREYFYAEFSKPFHHYQTWQNDALSQSQGQTGDHIGFVADESSAGRDQIEVRVGTLLHQHGAGAEEPEAEKSPDGASSR